VTVHEHVQQALSAMLDGQNDPDLGVIAGGGAEAGMPSLQVHYCPWVFTIENAMVPDFLPVPAPRCL
jgi:hypothetical protein